MAFYKEKTKGCLNNERCETSVELLIDKNEEGVVVGIEILGCQEFFQKSF